LSDAYRTEQREYYMNTSAWAEVHPAQLLGPGTLIKSYDLNKVTLDELKVREAPCGGKRRLLPCDFGLGAGHLLV
jgi:protein arginine N-methyltransferase 1